MYIPRQYTIMKRIFEFGIVYPKKIRKESSFYTCN